MKKAILNEKQQETLKDQILIVLADYQTCEAKSYEFGTSQRVRNEVANRIMNNLQYISENYK